MTAAEQAAATGGPVTQIPVDLGGEGIAYNLSLQAGARLHLTGPVLAPCGGFPVTWSGRNDLVAEADVPAARIGYVGLR
jgi:hypothetical protein